MISCCIGYSFFILLFCLLLINLLLSDYSETCTIFENSNTVRSKSWYIFQLNDSLLLYLKNRLIQDYRNLGTGHNCIM